MQDAKQKLLTRIQESTNVLVTVSNNPSLDQLSGAVGLTLLLNKLGKHATAVFSGKIPSSIEYLKPAETLEKDTNSLRDFIIALDKAKADKLRYKVEDKVVKIFITPYRTSLSEKDLNFSQGDFNVDLVMAIGVHDPKDLDQAIVSHGRILHDATVSSINNVSGGEMGTINWLDPKASSLCEMLYDLCYELKTGALDPQMATAFLTGIVAETHRFSNEKTSARTLDISGKLMAAGANQQLVAARLDIVPNEIEDDPSELSIKKADSKNAAKESGTLDIHHTLADIEADVDAAEREGGAGEIQIDEHGNIRKIDKLPEPQADHTPAAQALPDTPPPLSNEPGITKFSTRKPANLPGINSNLDEPESAVADPSLEPDHKPTPDTVTKPDGPKPPNEDVPKPPSMQEPPILGTTSTPDVSAARDAVSDAVLASPSGPLPARMDLNANPGLEMNHQADDSAPLSNSAPLPETPTMPPYNPSVPPANSPLPSHLVDAVPSPTDNSATPTLNPSAPPPLPPPLMPTDFGSTQPQPSTPPSSQNPLRPIDPPMPPPPPPPVPPQ